MSDTTKVFVGDRASDLNPADKVSRYRWSLAVGAVFCRVYTREGLYTIIAAGEDEFVRVSKTYLAGHGFHREDLVRIFRMMERHSTSHPPISEGTIVQ